MIYNMTQRVLIAIRSVSLENYCNVIFFWWSWWYIILKNVDDIDWIIFVKYISHDIIFFFSHAPSSCLLWSYPSNTLSFIHKIDYFIDCLLCAFGLGSNKTSFRTMLIENKCLMVRINIYVSSWNFQHKVYVVFMYEF